MECRTCGNRGRFLTERLIPHWVTVDRDGRVTSIDDIQGEIGENDMELTHAYTECASCTSTDIEED